MAEPLEKIAKRLAAILTEEEQKEASRDL